ncbi:class I SAM-dependent methyltransferase [Actinomadura barringtoniae]|uniref:Class I SAM-dependent methyltransferase n=1 Tax=Actinomadura barringtoniae TaxID=1427535 RepID=A0A939T5I8_9ACTN|nr:class I SAM-dependent methyltransferase [Actinomadura barringtoniae]MBO2450683.1 class I SAM-dependent methyltransferase [Actinomadura barringtoniae]
MPDEPQDVPPELDRHPDRLRWNAKYTAQATSRFRPHPLAERALTLDLPDGPVLDLASGPSGTALLAATTGRRVTAVDVSEVALGRLLVEAGRRELNDLIDVDLIDLAAWRPARTYALVICTGYWDGAVFPKAIEAVAPGGVLAWEAFTEDARRVRPSLPARWCLGPDEPASLLPEWYTVLDQHDLPDEDHGTKRQMLAISG